MASNLDQEPLMTIIVESVGDLFLAALIDADHARGDVIVDRGALARLPNERHDAKVAIGRAVEQVLAIVLRPV